MILLAFLLPTIAATQAAPDERIQNLKTLQSNQNWTEIVDQLRQSSPRSADEYYIYGLALAKLGKSEEARNAFLSGAHLSPSDARFPTEVAGLEFQANHKSEALAWLTKAHRLSPNNAYINDFLGTVYFLEGNLEACLKYWNFVGKPVVQNVRTEPALRVDQVILDRALAFAPGSKLERKDWLTSESRLRALGIYSRFGFRLEPTNDGRYDSVLQARELNGFGTNKWTALLSTFRGVIFETVTPEYYNLRGSATNIRTLYRWDKNKRRVAASIGGPVHRDPKWIYRASFDLRNENWALRNFSGLPVASLGGLNLYKQAGTVEIGSYRSGRWNLSTGAEISSRDYRSLGTAAGLSPTLFLGGKQLKHFVNLNADLLRLPEHRFVIASISSAQEGRTWNIQNPAFAKLQTGVRAHWFPLSSGDDYETMGQVRYGRTLGDVPFDELFMLGIERDNELRLRAHVGTDDGKKGFAPLGRNYFVSNWELDKEVYGNGLFRATLGPFVDSGKITDPSPGLGTQKWLLDLGAQVKVRAFGIRVALTYGKDTRTGRNAYYVYVTE